MVLKAIFDIFASLVRHPKIIAVIVVFALIEGLLSGFLLESIVLQLSNLFLISGANIALLPLEVYMANVELGNLILLGFFLVFLVNIFFTYLVTRLAKKLPEDASLKDSVGLTIRNWFQIVLVSVVNFVLLLFGLVVLLFIASLGLPEIIMFILIILGFAIGSYVQLNIIVLASYMALTEKKMNKAAKPAFLFAGRNFVGLFSLTVILLVLGLVLQFLINGIENEIVFSVLYLIVFSIISLGLPIYIATKYKEDKK